MVYAALTVLLALLPVVALLYMSYVWAVKSARAEMQAHARRAVASVDRAFTRIEAVLRELLIETQARCSAETLDRLTVAVYRYPEVRGVAVYDSNDVIRCTNFGLAEIDISPRLNEVASDDGGVSLHLANGLELARRGTAPAQQPPEQIEVASRRYPVSAMVAVPRPLVTARRPRRARKIIARLQELGVAVELDDAGIGHGGLAYLQKLGMDVIKIDKMFVDVIGTDSSAAPVADGLIDLAAQFGMEVIAEGVEERH